MNDNEARLTKDNAILWTYIADQKRTIETQANLMDDMVGEIDSLHKDRRALVVVCAVLIALGFLL